MKKSRGGTAQFKLWYSPTFLFATGTFLLAIEIVGAAAFLGRSKPPVPGGNDSSSTSLAAAIPAPNEPRPTIAPETSTAGKQANAATSSTSTPATASVTAKDANPAPRAPERFGKVVLTISGFRDPTTNVDTLPLGPVQRVLFLADGRHVLSAHPAVTAASNGQFSHLMLWDLAARARVARYPVWVAGSTGRIAHAIAVSRDGQWMAVGAADRTIRVWNLSAGEELGRCLGHSAPIVALAFSPDGRQLASANSDGTILVSEAPTGKTVHQLLGQSGPEQCLVFAFDGSLLFSSSSQSREVRVWNVATGKLAGDLAGPSAEVRCLAAQPARLELVSGHNDGSVVLWDLSSRKEQRRLSWNESGSSSRTDQPVRLAFSADGERVIAASTSVVALWHTATGQLMGKAPWPGPTQAIDLSPDGRFALSVLSDTTTVLTLSGDEPASNKELADTYRDAAAPGYRLDTGIAKGARIAPSGRLALLLHENNVDLYDLSDRQVRSRAEIANAVEAVFLPDEKQYAVIDRNGIGHVRSVVDGSPGSAFRIDSKFDWFSRAAASDDGDVLISQCGANYVAAGSAPNVYSWDLGEILPRSRPANAKQRPARKTKEDEVKRPLNDPALGLVTAIAVAPSGVRSAFATRANVFVRDARTASKLRELSLPTSPRVQGAEQPVITMLRLAATGQSLLGVLSDGRALHWRLEDPSSSPVELAINTTCGEWILERRYAVLGALDGSLSVWDVKEPRRLIRIRRHDTPVLGIAVSPKRDRLISYSPEGVFVTELSSFADQLAGAPEVAAGDEEEKTATQPEKVAALKLKLAFRFLANDPDKARGYCEEVLKLAPNSEAAIEAKKLLAILDK